MGKDSGQQHQGTVLPTSGFFSRFEVGHRGLQDCGGCWQEQHYAAGAGKLAPTSACKWRSWCFCTACKWQFLHLLLIE